MTSPSQPFDADLVRRIAALARLDIDDREAAELGRQFASILQHFAALSRLDAEVLENAEPTLGRAGPENVLRDDVAVPSLPVERVLANAPARDGDFYRVPKTVGGEG